MVRTTAFAAPNMHHTKCLMQHYTAHPQVSLDTPVSCTASNLSFTIFYQH
eukprot:c12962_g1_i2 orf=41-190(-)